MNNGRRSFIKNVSGLTAGINGYVGIEYEGDQLNEFEGIKATKALLEKVGTTLS